MSPLERHEGRRDFTERARFPVNSGHERNIYQRDGRYEDLLIADLEGLVNNMNASEDEGTEDKVRFMGRCSGPFRS